MNPLQWYNDTTTAITDFITPHVYGFLASIGMGQSPEEIAAGQALYADILSGQWVGWFL